MDSSLAAPIGKPAAGDFGRYSNPQAQAALAQFAGSGDPATQKAAITKLENIMTTQVPVIPTAQRRSLGRRSRAGTTTGWPTSSNPYMNPVPNTPYIEDTILPPHAEVLIARDETARNLMTTFYRGDGGAPAGWLCSPSRRRCAPADRSGQLAHLRRRHPRAPADHHVGWTGRGPGRHQG